MMEYKVNNVTLQIDLLDPEFTGDCYFEIPFSHKSFLKDGCDTEKNTNFNSDCYEPIFDHSYGSVYVDLDNMVYYSNSPDLLIAYINWLFTEDGEYVINAKYENMFWAIHDAEHAQYDSQSCLIHVTPEIEHERLEEAFIKMQELNIEIGYGLVETVTKAYNDRFSLDKNKPVACFEDYCTFEEDYD